MVGNILGPQRQLHFHIPLITNIFSTDMVMIPNIPFHVFLKVGILIYIYMYICMHMQFYRHHLSLNILNRKFPRQLSISCIQFC